MERVLILTADSGEELEVYYMLYRLREAGYAVDVAAPRRKTLELVVHDFEPGWDTYVERPGRRLDAGTTNRSHHRRYRPRSRPGCSAISTNGITARGPTPRCPR